MPMDRSPIDGVTIEQFYEVRARSGGYFEPNGGEAFAAALGIEPARWHAAYPKWQKREAPWMTDESLGELQNATMNRVFGPVGDIDVLAYADMVVTIHRNGGDLQAAAKKHGVNALVWSRESFEMAERMPRQPRLQAHYNVAYARSQMLGGQAVQKLRGDALRPAKRDPERFERRPQRKQAAAGLTKLRARRCEHCGAYKVKPHDRCWIYCDRCGALFDYDFSKLGKRDFAASQEAGLELRLCLENEDFPDDEAGIARQRLEGQRWLERILLELYPFDYPARVADPAYRDELLDGWLIPVTLCWAKSGRVHATGEAVTRFQSKLVGRGTPSVALVNKLFDVTVAHAEAQAAEADAAGCFGSHPDPLTPALWIRQTKSSFVQIFAHQLPDEARDALIERAGLREEYVDAPPAELYAMGCPCGAEIEVPVGALKVLCEACGLLHDCAARHACVACGATIVGDFESVRRAVGAIGCTYCGVRWEGA